MSQLGQSTVARPRDTACGVVQRGCCWRQSSTACHCSCRRLADTGVSGLVSRLYVWFRDADNIIYGPYSDEIIYDALAPRIRLKVVGSSNDTISLLFDALDDHSGITVMRIASELTFTNTAWEPLTNLVTRPKISPITYIQFRDAAGNLSPIYGTDGSDSSLTKKIYFPFVGR